MSDCCGKKRPALVWWILAALVVGVAGLVLSESRAREAPAAEHGAR